MQIIVKEKHFTTRKFSTWTRKNELKFRAELKSPIPNGSKPISSRKSDEFSSKEEKIERGGEEEENLTVFKNFPSEVY